MATQQAYDDLTTIKGIGRSRQQWLREQLDVKTYNDMASLLAEDVYAKLKDDGQIISLGDIESWIAQAHDLQAAASATTASKVRAKGWQPFGSFVIEFQENTRTGERRTSAHHVEADRTEIWAGVEQHNLCRWITRQLGDNQTDELKATDSLPEMEAQVEQVATLATPSAPIAVQLQSIQSSTPSAPVTPSTSDRLQQILAKANALKSVLPKSASNIPPVHTPTAKTLVTSSKQAGGFSSGLQDALRKAQQLASRRK